MVLSQGDGTSAALLLRAFSVRRRRYKRPGAPGLNFQGGKRAGNHDAIRLGRRAGDNGRSRLAADRRAGVGLQPAIASAGDNPRRPLRPRRGQSAEPSTGPAAAPPLVGECQPIPIRQLGLSNVVPDFRAGNSLARSVMARGASELIMIRKMAAAPIPRVTFIVTRGSF